MNFPDLTNKIISITTSDDTCNHDLQNASFQEIGGRLFVVGRFTKETTEKGWTEGRNGGVPWEIVTEYVIFDSYQDYKEALRISNETETT